MPDEAGARRGPTVFLVIALLIGVAAVFMVAAHLTPVVLAVVIGYLMRPLHRWLLRPLRKDWAAATVELLLVGILLIAPFVVLAFRFVQDAVRLVEGIGSREDLEAQVEQWLQDLGVPERHVDTIGSQVVSRGAQYLQEALVPIATMATEFVLAVVVFFLLLFYVLVDGPRLVAYTAHTLPAPDEDVRRMFERVGKRVKAIAFGTFFIALVQGVLAGVGWWILGLPAPVFWGFVMLVLSVVPVIGAFLVLIPAAIWAFAQGDIFAGVGLLVLNFVLVGLVDDVLRPLVIGKRSGVHPTLILIGVVGGLPLFGISGFILGPLLMSILAPLFEAWSHPEDMEGMHAAGDG